MSAAKWGAVVGTVAVAAAGAFAMIYTSSEGYQMAQLEKNMDCVRTSQQIVAQPKSQDFLVKAMFLCENPNFSGGLEPIHKQATVAAFEEGVVGLPRKSADPKVLIDIQSPQEKRDLAAITDGRLTDARILNFRKDLKTVKAQLADRETPSKKASM